MYITAPSNVNSLKITFDGQILGFLKLEQQTSENIQHDVVIKFSGQNSDYFRNSHTNYL